MKTRKILAATMASVMALGSVAIVANAEDTAVKAVKTKADLEAYLKSLQKFRDVDVYEFGTVSSAKMLDIFAYADSVLANEDSTVDDYTVTYLMIQAQHDTMKLHTVSELKSLLAKCKSAYESENMYNADLGDTIYSSDTFDTFASAYVEAEGAVESNESYLITDTYEVLEDAFGKLKKLDVVTKSQYTSAIKAFEKATMDRYAYDAWRVGTMKSGVKTASDTYAERYEGKRITWGALNTLVEADKQAIYDNYATFTGMKASKTSNEEIVDGYYRAMDATTILKSWEADTDSTRGSKTAVVNTLKDYHSVIVHDYAFMDAQALYQAVKDNVGEDVTLSVEKVDDSKVATKWVDAKTTEWGFCSTFTDFEYDDYTDEKAEAKKTVTKLTSAAMNVKAGADFYIPVTSEGYWDTERAVTFTKPSTTTGWKRVNKNKVVDLTEFIDVRNVFDAYDIADTTFDESFAYVDKEDILKVLPIDQKPQVTTSAQDIFVFTVNNGAENNIVDGGTDFEYAYEGSEKIVPAVNDIYNNANLAIAWRLANLYVNNKDKEIFKSSDTNDIYFVDTTGEIAKDSASGSVREITIVYNYLVRALEDKYSLNEKKSTYRKTDVSALIDKAYDLADKTGDYGFFHDSHMALVDARQEAREWLTAASRDKKYKDNESSYFGKTATQAYVALNKACERVENDFGAFKYSYGDIYNTVADIADKIDNGEVAANKVADVKAAMTDVIYNLINLGSMNAEYDIDNDVFEDGEFKAYNRVFTYGKAYKFGDIKIDAPADNAVIKSHDDLAKSYENLIALLEAPAVLAGDVDNDGKITAIDASYILQSVVGLKDAIDVKVGDYNADGMVTALDASAILQAVVNGKV